MSSVDESDDNGSGSGRCNERLHLEVCDGGKLAVFTSVAQPVLFLTHRNV